MYFVMLFDVYKAEWISIAYCSSEHSANEEAARQLISNPTGRYIVTKGLSQATITSTVKFKDLES